jgi:hypothetical protein
MITPLTVSPYKPRITSWLVILIDQGKLLNPGMAANPAQET